MSRCTLPTTPGALLGYRKNGQPIFLIAGGDGTTDQGQQQQTASTDTGAQSAQTGQQQQAASQQQTTQQTQDAGQQKTADTSNAQDVKSLPDWAQKLISDTRKEAGDARVAGKTAAEQAQKDLTDKLAVALGLKPDAATDPVELAKQIADAQTEAKASAVNLAVYQAASKHQGDPDALLDSTSFMTKVRELDHKAADFAAKVEAVIKDAVTSNPKLKAAQAAGKSGAQFTGGSGEGTTKQRPTSLHAALAAQRQS